MSDISINEKALKAHKLWKGKLATEVKCPINDKDDLSIAYTPGVAEPSMEIYKDEALSYTYTGKGNTVAVISDGTAVLGLGDIGPLAAMPVMEGKAALFKGFADIDAVPIVLDTKDTDEIVNIVKAISKSFGGINLEDISAPRCFEIEQRLREECDIPVFHDDQHGTAIVTCAAIINSLKLTGRQEGKVKIVINGAGSAGISIAKLIIDMKLGEVILCGRHGILYPGSDTNNAQQEVMAKITNEAGKKGSLAEAVKGADVLIGVSKAGAFTKELIESMNDDAIIFAMANPVPEIMPDLAKEAGAFIVGTGRSDFPNQVNNVLAFPGIFRGALDCRCSDITEAMKAASARAIADVIPEDQLRADYVLPDAFNKNVVPAVAKAVSDAWLCYGAGKHNNKVVAREEALECNSKEWKILSDSLGEVKLPKDAPWGAQTQRSKDNFPIGNEKMPMEVIYAIAEIKKAAAAVNYKMKRLPDDKRHWIDVVSTEITDGKWDHAFPLSVYQTGSGTQSNMNVNEVIAIRASALSKKDIHPNDHVNMGQSSNDVFPSAMHLSALISLNEQLLPAIEKLEEALKKLQDENGDIIKVGRTHLQDAAPMTFGQEVSGWLGLVENGKEMINQSIGHLSKLPIGGSAVGTGLNAGKDFGAAVVKQLNQQLGNRLSCQLYEQKNKFAGLSGKDLLCYSHSSLSTLASSLMKIATDIRLLASGPRCGFGEILLPANEPGSSIMPGKVNPTQLEALSMVAAKVMANQELMFICNSSGNLQLNTMMPVMISTFLQSVNLLSDVIVSLVQRALLDMKPNDETMKHNLEQSLMNVTAIAPLVGYDKAAEVAKLAFKEKLSLVEAGKKLGIDENVLSKLTNYDEMI